MNPGDPSSRCSMQPAVRHTTAINTPSWSVKHALPASLWLLRACCGVTLDAGSTAPPRGNLYNVVMHALRCFSPPHESLAPKPTIFSDTSGTMWHQARGLLSSSPPRSRFSPRVAVLISECANLFSWTYQTFFFFLSFGCSTVECAATAAVVAFFLYSSNAGGFCCLSLFFFTSAVRSMFLRTRVRVLRRCRLTFGESCWRCDIVWKRRCTLRARDSVLYSGFNICWEVCWKELCTTVFLVNWIFSYCMIRVSIVICKYFSR